MRSPLGVDEDIWRQRNKVEKKTYGKISAWRKGYKAGRKRKQRTDNPYKKKFTSEMWSLLRKAAYWDIGWELTAYRASKRKLDKIKKHDIKIKVEKKKHKHRHKHRKHRHDSSKH